MRLAALILSLLLVGAAVADDAVADDAAPGEGEEPHYVDGQHNPK
jgi:hypothetical protein